MIDHSSYRKEIKYYISPLDRSRVRTVAGKLLEPDVHNKSGKGYFVRSLYFDDKEESGFFDKLAGVARRSKYRLRIYDLEADKVKFEIKERRYDYIVKQTAWISRRDAEAVQLGDYDCLLKYDNKVLNKIYCKFKSNYFRPVAMIDYWREAFCYGRDQVRLTIDYDLSATTTHLDLFFQPQLLPLLPPHKVILEVKFRAFLPAWMTKSIGFSGFIRCAISKYCMARSRIPC